jgi:hypothetical protein
MRHRNLTLAAAAAGSALLIPQTASAAIYRVVQASHSSNAAKTDLPYQGTSSARWSLAPRTKDANNRFSVSRGGGLLFGAGYVNVKGVFDTQASSDTDSCSLSAPTGSEEYRAVAPMPLILALTKDPQGRPTFAFTGIRATLGNSYFGTGCSTSLAGEPDTDVTNLKRVKASLFRKTAFTIRLAGSTAEGGIAYRYSTVLKFKRVRR